MAPLLGPISSEHAFFMLLLLSGDVETNPGPTDILVKEVDIHYLVELIGLSAYKWRDICGQCGLLPSELEAIGRELVNIVNGHTQCLAAGLAIWCNISSGDGIHCKDPKLEILVQALQSRVVDEGVLAEKISQNCDNLPSAKLSTKKGEDGPSQGAEMAPTPNAGNYGNWPQNSLEVPAANYQQQFAMLYPPGGYAQVPGQGGWQHQQMNNFGGVQFQYGSTMVYPSQLPSALPSRPTPDVQCKYSQYALERYSKFLKEHYTKESVSPDYKWPRTPSTQYVNLAIVKKRRVNRAQANEFTLATLHGDIDQILKEKEPIEFEKVLEGNSSRQLRYVLVEGAPGVGKSTFAWELCKKWDDFDSLKKYSLIVNIRLRDKRVQGATTLSDLFYHYDQDLQRAITHEIRRTDGERVLLIMDGADELPASIRTDTTSIFSQIVSGYALPKATILVTSRPSAITQLVRMKEPDKHIEILGFSEEQIHEYAESIFGPDTKPLHDFERYISSTPAIKGMLYVPLNTAIVLEVYQENKTKERPIPNTLTCLYTELCLLLLQRYLIGAEPATDPDLVDDLCNLPQLVQEPFMKLAEIAFNGVFDKMLVFPNFPEIIKGLGFTTASEELYTGRRATHSFLHLTIQEYLAAYFIAQLSPDKQNEFFQEHSGKDHLDVVWRFFAGITGFEKIGWDIAKSVYSSGVNVEDSVLQISEGSTHVSLIMLRCLFEAQSRGCVQHALTSEEIIFSTGTSESFHPFDFFALGYCIAHSSQCSWKVIIRDLNLQGDLVEMFTSGMLSSSQLSSSVDALSLKATPLGQEGVTHLERLPPVILNKIQVFSLDQCGIDMPTLSRLAHLFPQMSQLKSVSIQLYHKGGQNEAESHIDITVLVQSFSSCKELHSLQFPQGFHWNETSFEELRQLITPNRNLTSLYISCTALSRKFTPLLLDILLTESSLQSLSIYGLALVLSRNSAKLTLLEKNANLRTLKLINCQLGNRGAQTLAEALANNTFLTHLHLDGNHRINENGGEALSQMLSKNITLKSVKVSFDESLGAGYSAAARSTFPDLTEPPIDNSKAIACERDKVAGTVHYSYV